MKHSQLVSRRLFLRGAAGAAVALPILPSLMTREAVAQDLAAPPRLVLMGSKQGAFANHLYGDVSAKLPNRQALFGEHELRWGAIPSSTADGKTVITRILQADSSVLTDRLIQRMNIIQGMDTPSIGGHNSSQFGQLDPGDAVPSIDQVVAWSPSYYGETPFTERSILAGYWSASAYHSNPQSRTGNIGKVSSIGDPQELWDRLFGGFTPKQPADTEDAPPQKPLVDHVLEHYRLVRNSNRRLSAEDRFRLDGHMEMLSELQRRIKSVAASGGAACELPQRTTKSYPYNFVKESGGPDTPPDQLRSPAESLELHQLYNDVIAAAFRCGLTRVAVVHPYEKNDPFSSYKYNWHTAAHKNSFDIFADAYQAFFEGVFLDLANKLDVDEGSGQSYLDNTLMVWVNEHGALTHSASDKMLITFGSAGGYFKTGLFVDYRNLSPQSLIIQRAGVALRTGLTMNQWWANVLHAIGIPREEWERYGGGPGGGYGKTALNQEGSGKLSILHSHYGNGPLQRTGERLPIITA